MQEPVRSDLSYAAIREYAEKIGSHHDIYDENGHADVDGLFATLGGRVHPFLDLPEPLIIEEPNSFVVSQRSFINWRKQRFFIAKSIGHYFLHYRYPGIETYMKFYGRASDSEIDTQANHFAATLIMPAKQFTQQYEKLEGDRMQLSELFDISPLAVKVRAELLGLL